MDDQAKAIKDFICDRVLEVARNRNSQMDRPGDDFNLLESGLFDSLGFVELIAALEGEFGVGVDFGEMNPEEFSTIGGLVASVLRAGSAQAG